MAGDAFLLLHLTQAPQITARDILEYAESNSGITARTWSNTSD